MSSHFQWDLPLSLPSPRAGATRLVQRAARGMKGEGSCTFYATSGFILRLEHWPGFRPHSIALFARDRVRPGAQPSKAGFAPAGEVHVLHFESVLPAPPPC